MHASMQNAAFAECKDPLGILVFPANGTTYSGGPSEYSAVTEYWPGLSKTNPAPSLSEITLSALISCHLLSTAKSEGEYCLDAIGPLPCRGTSLPSGPTMVKVTNSSLLKRLTKIGSSDRL